MLTAIKGRWEAENSGLPLATWAHLNFRSLRKRATKKFDHAVANHTFKLLIWRRSPRRRRTTRGLRCDTSAVITGVGFPRKFSSHVRLDLRPRGASSAIHRLIGETVGILIMFTKSMSDFDVLDLSGQTLCLVVKFAQFRMADLINALHLANHKLGIADDFERRYLMRDGITKGREQPVVLGIVVGLMAEILAELGNFFPLRIVNDKAVACRAGIAPGSAVDVGSVGGRIHAESLMEKFPIASSWF